MEQIQIGDSGLTSSRIGLGTWAIGGWMRGGSDEHSLWRLRVMARPVTRPAAVETAPIEPELAK